MCQSEAHWLFLIWLPLCPTFSLSRYSRYLMRKFCDLDLGQFKVIRGQRLWSQGWFHIRLPLTPSWYLSPFSRCLTLKLFFHKSSGENQFHFWFVGPASFGFPPKTRANHISRDSTLVASLLKIGGGLRSVERSTRFMWQTDWLTHRQSDFIICPMLLMDWPDKR